MTGVTTSLAGTKELFCRPTGTELFLPSANPALKVFWVILGKSHGKQLDKHTNIDTQCLLYLIYINL